MILSSKLKCLKMMANRVHFHQLCKANTWLYFITVLISLLFQLRLKFLVVSKWRQNALSNNPAVKMAFHGQYFSCTQNNK